MDNSSIDWKTIIIGFTVGQYVFESYLGYRQYQVYKRTTPPNSIKAEISKETFDKSQDYSRAKAKFGFISDTFSLLKNLYVIKYDVLSSLWGFSGVLMSKCATVLPSFMGGVITQSLFFITVSQLISSVIDAPLDYYYSFVLEEKYGFNKMTLSLWLTDKVKGQLLSIALGSPVMAGFLKIIDYFGDKFIVFLCIFILVVQLVFMTIYPTLIQPLFNKFTPLEEGELRTAIENLASEHKFPLTKLFVVDGSKRSSHSNAYFVGLPWSKQIVLFDTLIKQTETEETVAVLAHEIGHWKLNHLIQLLSVSQAQVTLIFLLFSGFIHNGSLYKSFGFDSQPILIGFLLFSDIFTPLNNVFQFGSNSVVRKNEYQADAYAKECGYSDELARALIKIASENLGSINADWLYSAYNHSHPILADRLSALDYVSKEKIGSLNVEKKAEKAD